MSTRTATTLVYAAALFPIVFGYEHFLTAVDDWHRPDVMLDPGMRFVPEPTPHPLRGIVMMLTASVHFGAVVWFLSVFIQRRVSEEKVPLPTLSWGLWLVAACEAMFLPYSVLYVTAWLGFLY